MLIELGTIDYALLIVYFAFVLGIGFVLRKGVGGTKDFFESGRALPAWICALGFIGANLGAQEVMGMAASGAKYGIMTSHFYWMGAIPAMVFVAVFMMPFYYGSKARSVPEYLKLRFDEKTRGFNAITFAGMTVLSSGISMYALATLLHAILGWNFHLCIVASGVIVLVYIFLGGLTSAIYNEVLQFFLIVFGFLPLVLLGLKQIGGWAGLMQRLRVVATQQRHARRRLVALVGAHRAAPRRTRWASSGSGWRWAWASSCRSATGARTSWSSSARWRRRSWRAARRTPLIAAFPKMLFPFLVILPGMIAIALHVDGGGSTGFALPVKGDSLNYDMVVPADARALLPDGLLGLGLTALIASFMSGMAGNVTAFNTVWTYDIYQATSARTPATRTTCGSGAWRRSPASAPASRARTRRRSSTTSWTCLQLVFAFVNAPLFATFLLGHVLAARDGPRRVLRAAGGHGGRRRPPRPVAAQGRGGRDQGRLAVGGAPLSRARWRRTSGPRSGRSRRVSSPPSSCRW